MNIDQLTAKFAQAYTKRAEDPTFTSQQLAPLGSEDITSAVRGAQNAPAYLGRATPSGGGLLSDAGTPFQVQSGPTGTLSGAPELLARPIETQQSYGAGAFLDPTSAGFYSPFLDVPFVGADQSGFGTGASLLSGAGAYGATKGYLNRRFLSPSSYLPNLPRSAANLTPAAADTIISKSLGYTNPFNRQDFTIGPGASVQKVEGNPALRADVLYPGVADSALVDTPDYAALRSAMLANPRSVIPGPGVGPYVDLASVPSYMRGQSVRRGNDGAPILSPSERMALAMENAISEARGPQPAPFDAPPVQITSTVPSKGKGKGKGEGGAPVATRATFNPGVPLLRPGSRIPTAAGVRAAIAPSSSGGMPTGARGSLRGRAPMYAALAGMTIPQLFNLYNYGFNAPEDPTGGPFSGFVPRVGYNPAVLSAEPGFFSDTPTIYENVVGRDVPVQ
jgi:hypothetical protein